MRLIFALALATVVAVAGCGGANDPATEIRQTEHEMLSALQHDNNAKFCSHTTDAGGCLASLAMAKAFLGSGGKITDLLTKGDLKKADQDIDRAPIVIAKDGRHATVPAYDGSDPAKWEKQDGGWKLVFSTDG